MRKLDVFWNGIRAGRLMEFITGHSYLFEYTPDYVASPLPPISVTLPKRIEPYEADSLFPFFANMLPEGALRRVVCRECRVDEHDFFGMLTATANVDNIGAVSCKTVTQ